MKFFNKKFLFCPGKANINHLCIDKNPETIYGETPLLLAAKNGQVEKFKLLLDYNEDKNPRRKIGYGFTPFHYAVLHGHLPICKIIVEVLSKTLSKGELLETLAKVSRQKGPGSNEVCAWLDGVEFGLKL